MLHAGLDLSRRKLDVCLLSDAGEHLDQLTVPSDVDSLRTLASRIEEVHGEPVSAVVKSMTGARIVHERSSKRAGRRPNLPPPGAAPGQELGTATGIRTRVSGLRILRKPFAGVLSGAVRSCAIG